MMSLFSCSIMLMYVNVTHVYIYMTQFEMEQEKQKIVSLPFAYNTNIHTTYVHQRNTPETDVQMQTGSARNTIESCNVIQCRNQTPSANRIVERDAGRSSRDGGSGVDAGAGGSEPDARRSDVSSCACSLASCCRMDARSSASDCCAPGALVAGPSPCRCSVPPLDGGRGTVAVTVTPLCEPAASFVGSAGAASLGACCVVDREASAAVREARAGRQKNIHEHKCRLRFCAGDIRTGRGGANVTVLSTTRVFTGWTP